MEAVEAADGWAAMVAIGDTAEDGVHMMGKHKAESLLIQDAAAY